MPRNIPVFFFDSTYQLPLIPPHNYPRICLIPEATNVTLLYLFELVYCKKLEKQNGFKRKGHLMADGLFKSLYDGFREEHHSNQRRKVLDLISPDLFEEPDDLLNIIEHCCEVLINPHTKWKTYFHKPSYYQQLAKRVVKCIEVCGYEKEIESLEGRCSRNMGLWVKWLWWCNKIP